MVPFQFTVVNNGGADLELAEVNTQYFRGAVTKHLTVRSNDPEQPQLELLMTAHLVPLVKISPSTTAVLTVGETPVTHEFTLERNEGRPMKLVQVIANAPYLKAEATPLPGGGRYKLTVTVSPDAPLGRSMAPVAVWTDLEKCPSLTLVVTVDRGIISVPPMLFFGVVPHDLTTPRQAQVTILRNATPFHINSVTVHDPHLAAKLETVREGMEYRVNVTYAGGWDAGRQRQTLTVTTDDPKQPVIEIPVQAAVQAKIAHASPVAIP